MNIKRIDPSIDAAFPLLSWQDGPQKLKTFAKERVSELRGNHEGEDEAMAKIIACEARWPKKAQNLCQGKGQRT